MSYIYVCVCISTMAQLWHNLLGGQGVNILKQGKGAFM